MQKFIAIGRLTKEPEVRYTQGGTPTALAKFTLAVDRKFKKDGEPTADFINCTSFGKTAEFVEKWFTKGSKIVVVGRLTTGNYTNKDGVKVYTTDVTVEEVEFAESKASEGNGGNVGASRPSPSKTDKDGFMAIPDGIDEELPFN